MALNRGQCIFICLVVSAMALFMGPTLLSKYSIPDLIIIIHFSLNQMVHKAVMLSFQPALFCATVLIPDLPK